MATNTTAELGSKDNPYTMTEYEKLANSGSWKGGYVFFFHLTKESDFN